MNENGTTFGGGSGGDILLQTTDAPCFCIIKFTRSTHTPAAEQQAYLLFFYVYSSYNIILVYQIPQQNNTNSYARQGFYQ